MLLTLIFVLNFIREPRLSLSFGNMSQDVALNLNTPVLIPDMDLELKHHLLDLELPAIRITRALELLIMDLEHQCPMVAVLEVPGSQVLLHPTTGLVLLFLHRLLAWFPIMILVIKPSRLEVLELQVTCLTLLLLLPMIYLQIHMEHLDILKLQEQDLLILKPLVECHLTLRLLEACLVILHIFLEQPMLLKLPVAVLMLLKRLEVQPMLLKLLEVQPMLLKLLVARLMLLKRLEVSHMPRKLLVDILRRQEVLLDILELQVAILLPLGLQPLLEEGTLNMIPTEVLLRLGDR